MKRAAATIAGVALLAGVAGCNLAKSPDTRADEAAIRTLDAEWVKAAQTKHVEEWLAFYSDDAVVLPPNDKIATSRAGIRKPIGELLGLPGLAITWQPAKVEVARSGDLAYLYGTYELSWDEAQHKRATDRGKNVEIWKRQSGGDWKCVVDTWNSDIPAPPSAPK